MDIKNKIWNDIHNVLAFTLVFKNEVHHFVEIF